MLVVAFVQGTASGFHGSTQGAVLRTVVPPEQRAAASARNEAGIYGATVAGPPLGGALFALAPSAPFLADAVSYAISLVTLLGVRGHFRPEPADLSDWEGDQLTFVVVHDIPSSSWGSARLLACVPQVVPSRGQPEVKDWPHRRARSQ
ncbi:MAG: MFS transporter [Candidatus Dormibacteria bacterium]